MMLVYHDMIIKNVTELSYLLIASKTDEQRDELIDFMMEEYDNSYKVDMLLNMAFMLIPDGDKKDAVRKRFEFTILNTEDLFASVV